VSRRALRGAAALGALLSAVTGCTTDQSTSLGYGIGPCPAAAEHDLLGPDALQCWWQARHGRWRTLSHDSHYDALVVDVEARDARDAREIADLFVREEGRAYAEILIYVHPDASARSSRVRRVRWSRTTGFETLDFGG
jgi:hypothetical protein